MILSPAANPQQQQQIDVTADDQQMINRFARLNLKFDELQTKFNEYKRQQENLEEAENELMLQDDDFGDDDGLDDGDNKMNDNQSTAKDSASKSSNIQFVVGTSFMAVTKSECEKLIEEKKNELVKKMKSLSNEIQPMKDEMNEIKSKLYAKFGNNINLDSEES